MSTTTLHNEKIKTLVPKLRFHEFDGEWEKNENTIQIIAGNAYSLNEYQNEGIILIQGLNITPGKLDISAINYISETHKAKHIILSEGDILLGLNRPVTNGELKVCRYNLKTKGYLYQRAGKLEFNKQKIYTDFLYQYIRSDDFLKGITNELVGSDQPYIRSNLFQIIKLNFPTLPEQQKIASFLSAVDEKIQQLTRKATLLEHYKKGVMQQLFSGKLRFKDEDGKDYPDWEEKKLEEVLKIGSGKDYKHLEKGSIPVFGTGGYMLSVNKFLHSGETVFIGRKGTIDKPFYFNGDFWTVDTLFYTHTFKNVIPKFIYCVFQQINWKLHNEASGVPSLSKSTIEKLKFKFPRVEEQQKIANFLSGIDSKIESVNQQLAQMQTFKKGLLQQMFV